MLGSLGKRIERLFYFGFLLILLSFVELYFSSAAVFFSNTNESTASFYLSKMEQAARELNFAFVQSTVKISKAELDKRRLAIAENRAALGLPPEEEKKEEKSPKSYKTMLKEIYDAHKHSSNKSEEQFSAIFNAGRSPDQIVEQLGKIKEDEIKAKGMVWGIETPRLFSINYGKSDYSVPAQFLAFVTFTALAPVILAWLGSFYVTRQRELLLIRELHDFRQSFPHILNIFHISFVNLARNLGIHKSRKSIYSERRIGGILTAIFRSIVVMTICLPMVLCSAYSFYNLYSIVPDGYEITLLLGAILTLTYLIICLQILVQESTLMYKKNFYA
jgi:hypothetical protein